MPPRVQAQEIDGLEARTLKLPALQAYDLLTKLGEVITPLITAMASLEGESLLEQDLEKLGPILRDAFKSVKGAEGRALIRETLVCTSVVVNGANLELISDAKINEAFEDTGLLTLFKVIAFVIQVNYRDFIDAAKARAAKVKAARQAAKLLADAATQRSHSPSE